MAPLAHNLRKRSEDFLISVISTGQHRELMEQSLETFQIRPDTDLGVMATGQTLAKISSAVLVKMEFHLLQNRPDAVLVHGDTSSALAAALASFYQKIPVGHVEAGLRTYNLRAPFPEEFNRQVISKISAWHFAPTESSASNLLKEEVEKAAIIVTGNTVKMETGYLKLAAA